MQGLLKISAAIDKMNDAIGRTVMWCILAAVLISTANAIIRKLFDQSSNAWLEMQWQLFGAVFMLCSAYTFLRNEHIRIDIVNSRFSKRTRDWIDLFGHFFFLMPFAILMIVDGFPFFWRSFSINEGSMNAGGIVQWTAKFLIPAGFVLLFVQGISEIIKRWAIIQGLIPDPHQSSGAHQAPLGQEHAA